jgi:peptidoglycan hydrolase CwlO-like protein
MVKGNGKTEHRITKLEGCVNDIQGDISEIKNTINNHIPTSIKELDTKIDGIVETINKRPTWLMTFVFLLLSFLLGLVATHYF